MFKFKFNMLKIMLVVFFIFLYPGITFAQEFTVTGMVTDKSDNPIPFSTLEFINTEGELSGKVESSYDGQYEIQVEQGVYAVKVTGPKDSGIGSTEYENQAVNDETVLNYNLGLDQENSGNKSSSKYFMLVIFAASGLLILLGFVFLYRRHKK